MSFSHNTENVTLLVVSVKNKKINHLKLISVLLGLHSVHHRWYIHQLTAVVCFVRLLPSPLYKAAVLKELNIRKR